MLATLHGKSALGCANCKGFCEECSSLTALQGFDASRTLGFSLTSFVENTLNPISLIEKTADVVIQPIKSLASSVEDVASGNWSQALHDQMRLVSGVITAPIKELAAVADTIPGVSGAYDAVTKFTSEHAEAITIATAVIAATILTLGEAGVFSAGIGATAAGGAATSAGTTVAVATTGTAAAAGAGGGITASSVAGALTTATAAVTAGNKLLSSGKLNPTQTANVTNAVNSIKAAQGSIPWYVYLAPVLFFL